jgi:hypothetical protein
VSHRGVEPGAIHFREDGDGASAATILVWPDYVGNFLFNTLGNLVKDPRCGLLFIDFGPSGDVLQLTGRATVEWDVREVPGAHRSVAFTVQRARLVRGALSMLRSTFLERSPFLPAATSACLLHTHAHAPPHTTAHAHAHHRTCTKVNTPQCVREWISRRA